MEGDSEYILLEAFYKNTTNEKLEDSNIHVISVGGTSFKRYLDLSKLLNIKTAIVRDNDKDFESNCINRYSEYLDENIKVFYEEDNEMYTFEISLYKVNKDSCDDLFKEDRKTLSVQEFMLKNKADAAFELLDKKEDQLGCT